jgi:tyrosine-protein phosphatase YwqE
LQVAGYTPVLHPERYLFYQNNFDEYKTKESGLLVSVKSIISCGVLRRSNKQNKGKLLTQGLYDYVGSDVHHDNHIAAFSQK